MKLSPSSIYWYFNKVESVITAKIISGQCNLQQSKKLASSLALLPFVQASQNSMSLMIQKILIVVNSMLNDTFLGLEEGHSDHEVMMLLTPPGSKLEPPLGEQLTYEDGHIHSTKKFRAYVVPTISSLIHCCSVMLTSSYPSQVINVPVRSLVTVIRKVLLVDGSLHKSLFQSNTPFHQEIICSEIPTLHSTFLDLLASTVKRMRSSLIPHADVIVMLIAEYFKRARLPAIRRKLYTVVQLLLSSMGVGMAMQLLLVVISNIFADLDATLRSGLSSLSTDPIEATIWSSSNSSSNRNRTQQQQSSIVVTSEPTCNRQIMAPICAKIAALETLEILLNVGGSFRACSWRTEMDLLLIDVARNACYKAGMYEQRSPWTEDTSISDFQLALFKALLASFLSNPHGRPPYLEQGIKLFSRGKLETSIELANFCSHALLALDVLIHPRQLHPQYVSQGMARDDLVFRSGATERVLGSERSQSPCPVRKCRATDDLGDECKHRLVSIAKEPTDGLAKDGSAEKHTPVELCRDLSLRKDAQQSNTTSEEHPEMATYCLPAEEVQTVPAFIRTDVKMAGGSCSTPAGFDTLGNPPGSFTVSSAPIVFTPSDARDPGDEISNKKCGYKGRTLSGDAFSSQNVQAHTSPISAAPSVFGSEWDSLEPLLDIGDADADPNFSPDMVNVHPESY